MLVVYKDVALDQPNYELESYSVTCESCGRGIASISRVFLPALYPCLRHGTLKSLPL